MVLSELGIAAGCNPGPNSTIFEMDFKENGLMNLGPILMEGSKHLWLHMAGIWRKKFKGVRRYKRILVTATKTQIPLKPNY
jgi:hypothetical protein